MTFEYQPSLIGGEIPDLVIPVSEILKTKFTENEAKNEKAFAAKKSFECCLKIYTFYCGREIRLIPSEAYKRLYEQIGKDGKVIFTCVEQGDIPRFLVRVISNEGEKEIDSRFLTR